MWQHMFTMPVMLTVWRREPSHSKHYRHTKHMLPHKAFTSKFVGTGPSFYKKIIYRAAVSQRLRNTAVECTSATWRLYEQICCSVHDYRTTETRQVN